MEKGNKRLAVLVGCNYPNTRNELHGCLNDVLTMKDVLVSRFGFEPANIELLTDVAPSSSVMPTGVNIMDTLHRMVDHAEPGDVLFFHYSGHGTRIPSNHGFKHEEAIVPCDFNLITDVDFRRLVNRLPVGASFTVFSDSCHSGGLIDKEKEQIGPYVADFSSSLPNNRTKIIPYDSIIAHLTSISGIQSSNIGVHLSEVFGNQSSLNTRLGQRESDPLGPLHPDSGILLSGCQANETSADINPKGRFCRNKASTNIHAYTVAMKTPMLHSSCCRCYYFLLMLCTTATVGRCCGQIVVASELVRLLLLVVLYNLCTPRCATTK